MNSRRGTLLLSIIIWSGFTQIWFFGIVLFALIAINHKVQWRWNIKTKQFYRITDFCIVLILIILSYGYVFNTVVNPIFTLLKLAPLWLAPILIAQLYSIRTLLPIGTLLYSMRKASSNEKQDIDFTLPFSIAALLSCASVNLQSPIFFITLCVILSYILWLERPGHVKNIMFLLIVSIATLFGHFSHNGLKQLSSYVQEIAIEWLTGSETNPFKTYTSIGQVGELKLSDKIVFRVKSDRPLLLHQASYNLYFNKEWHASETTFSPYIQQKISNKTKVKKIEIYQDFSSDIILALPDGPTIIKDLAPAQLSQSKMGAVKAVNLPSWAHYSITYTDIRLSEESKFDLKVPKQHLDWLNQVSKKLKLKQKSPVQIMKSIKAYFQSQYFYTLYTPKQVDADQALINFMLKRKAGHCEYFAIASVFLLRYSGIPARLVNGFSVQEYDASSDLYIVRARHSHAWATAKVDDTWQALDATPSQWLQIEEQDSHIFQPISDWFSKLYFHFNQWRLSSNSDNKIFIFIGLILFSLYLLRLVDKNKQLATNNLTKIENMPFCTLLGEDSEYFIIDSFYRSEKQEELKLRQNNETLLNWVQNLDDPQLKEIIKLHNKLRFDPEGLTQEQRIALRERVTIWLDKKSKKGRGDNDKPI